MTGREKPATSLFRLAILGVVCAFVLGYVSDDVLSWFFRHTSDASKWLTVGAVTFFVLYLGWEFRRGVEP